LRSLRAMWIRCLGVGGEAMTGSDASIVEDAIVTGFRLGEARMKVVSGLEHFIRRLGGDRALWSIRFRLGH
jgi:hypothetical protein